MKSRLMKSRPGPSSSAAGPANFDLLRAKVELEVAPPAIIAITSCTAEDGKEIACWGLATSLVTTGYTTLYLDACLANSGVGKPLRRLTLQEAGRLLTPDSEAAKLSVLNLGDLLMQRTTSLRHIQSALEVLRSKFDYVIINTEYGASTAFAASVVATADAVLVTVKKGRRETADDTRLARGLEDIGSGMLGAVALDPSLFSNASTTVTLPGPVMEHRPSEIAHVNREPQSREVVEWRT